MMHKNLLDLLVLLDFHSIIHHINFDDIVPIYYKSIGKNQWINFTGKYFDLIELMILHLLLYHLDHKNQVENRENDNQWIRDLL
jgi:hypothetical protein